ncbi:hypothetical protein [Candidatus Viadribacter manganicus]|uniref:Uncharacterized protein n=1 Tax=Candidatus Viadribacter manganicus TaxID=1759059 RepID=A0A1B1AE79_9PROT|nr:hypothetical protein [Candidatus Viadribacter manganicus]ANP44852.1 hypothetical protein ATE48_02385 [Candidatus Viadribacter manganicus]
MPEIKDRDPYAPPPMHHDRSGAVLRVTLLAAMLGAAGLGYAWMSSQPRTALVPQATQDQQVADAGYRMSPEGPVEGPVASPEQTPAANSGLATPTDQTPTGQD